MFCKNCGKEIPDGVKFCENCGQPVETAENSANLSEQSQSATDTAPVQDQGVFSSAAPAQDQGVFSSANPAQDQDVFTSANTNKAAPASTDAEWGMKWHKVLQVILVLGAIFNMIGSLSYFTGAQYNDPKTGANAQIVYAAFGNGLKALDMFYGLCCVVLGIYGIIVVMQLHGKKKLAPMLLLGLYGANFCFTILYLICGTAITGVNLFNASTIGSLTGSIVMIVVNKIYYDHRKHLFIN